MQTRSSSRREPEVLGQPAAARGSLSAENAGEVIYARLGLIESRLEASPRARAADSGSPVRAVALLVQRSPAFSRPASKKTLNLSLKHPKR